MPKVRIKHGSQEGAITDYSDAEAQSAAHTGYAEIVEARDGQWVAVGSSTSVVAPPAAVHPPAKPPKKGGK